MTGRKILLAPMLGAFLLLFTGAALAQGKGLVPYQEGLHYFKIEQASALKGDKVEVLELFSYLCNHCNTFEPYVNSWVERKPDYVDFRRVPVVFGRGSWELYARAYATAEIMNLPEEVHMAMMDRLWKDRKIMRSLDEIADFYVQFGADKEKFLSTAQSFAVDGKIRKDQQLVREYGITGTPSIVVNGKYRVTGSSALPSFDAMLDLVDYLVGIEKAALLSNSVAAE
ncbi:MAG: thiol:disulfide interchange protein DsbA/DsbL [Xanthomonadales bacterium]|jgi:thiol:disulfide interchange protein DsbA|nr:thiol:disulfide interchange protein DsbA/DsbL [Xanthomonadales bacterium]